MDQHAEDFHSGLVVNLNRSSQLFLARRREQAIGCGEFQQVPASQFEMFTQLFGVGHGVV